MRESFNKVSEEVRDLQTLLISAKEKDEWSEIYDTRIVPLLGAIDQHLVLLNQKISEAQEKLK